MTAQQEVRFKCNRCLDEVNQPLQNIPAVDRAMRGPEGWLTLWIDDQTKAAFHLCPPCAFGFTAYMQGTAISGSTDALAAPVVS